MYLIFGNFHQLGDQFCHLLSVVKINGDPDVTNCKISMK